MELLSKILHWVFVSFFSYFVVLFIYQLFLILVGMLETEKRADEETTEDYVTLSGSAFTLPVSIIIPVRNEADWIGDSLKAVLNLDYPEFEVIVVDDGSTDDTLKILDGFLKLKGVDRVFADRFHAGKVREVFESQNYPNVHVICKESGYKKAGALNMGLNFARQKYVCVVDADTILEPDALLKVMAQVEKNPDEIIAVGSYFGLVNGFTIQDGKIIKRGFSYNPIVAYQNLEYIRTFIGNRTAWSHYNAMPNIAGGFSIWRRHVLLELGGFTADFTCEDIELTFRAHDYIAKHRDKGYKIMNLPYPVGWTEGPSNFAALITQRDRWQRVTDETVWAYKYMCFNPRYGLFGLLTFPYFLLFEVFGSFIEVAAIASVTWGWWIGVLDVNLFLAMFFLMLLSQVYLSLLSIFALVRTQKIFKVRAISHLVILTFFELFWYRWLISIAKLSGTISYLLGYKAYDKYEREKRTAV